MTQPDAPAALRPEKEWTQKYNCQHRDRDGLVCRVCADTEMTSLRDRIEDLEQALKIASAYVIERHDRVNAGSCSHPCPPGFVCYDLDFVLEVLAEKITSGDIVAQGDDARQGRPPRPRPPRRSSHEA